MADETAKTGLTISKRRDLRRFLDQSVKVIKKPDDGDGSDWWLIFDLDESMICDTSTFSRTNAMAAAAGFKKQLFGMLVDVLEGMPK